jgi:hypothetical protein
VLVQVKSRRERSMPVWPLRSGETGRLGSKGPVTERDQVRVAWWHETQDEVMYGFLVEPQNQSRAETSWEPSHEWRLASYTKFAGFPVVHQKSTGFLG